MSVNSSSAASTAPKASQAMRSLRGALRKTFLLLRERFPLTSQGVIVLVVATLALQRFAYGRMDLVVFALAVCALAIVCFSTVIVLLGGLILRHQIRDQLEMEALKRRHTPRIKVEAGYPNETGFRLSTMPWLPLIGVTWEIVQPDAITSRNHLSEDETHWEEEIVPSKRCHTQHITRRYTVRDVLGFSRFTWRFTQEGELLALPQSGNIKALPLLRSLTAEDGIPDPGGNPEGDRMEIRPYVLGDSVRNIMWKVYARNRQLNVRLAERSVFHSSRTLAYMLSSPNDEAAAAVARVAVESGALGEDWLFGADGSDKSTQHIDEALELIAGSRALDGELAYGLDNFLNAHAAQSNVHCIIFVGAEMSPNLERLRASISRFRVRFSVVLATDGLTSDVPVSPWRRLLFRTQRQDAQANESTEIAQLSRLLTQVGQLVESTLVVDRQSGQSFDKRMNRI